MRTEAIERADSRDYVQLVTSMETIVPVTFMAFYSEITFVRYKR